MPLLITKKQNKKAYREANREKIAAQEKAYREENKEKRREWASTWRAKNAEKCASYLTTERKAKIKAYREANQEKIAAQEKAYREANKEKRREWNIKSCIKQSISNITLIPTQEIPILLIDTCVIMQKVKRLIKERKHNITNTSNQS